MLPELGRVDFPIQPNFQISEKAQAHHRIDAVVSEGLSDVDLLGRYVELNRQLLSHPVLDLDPFRPIFLYLARHLSDSSRVGQAILLPTFRRSRGCRCVSLYGGAGAASMPVSRDCF